MQHFFRGKSILLILFIAVASISISSFYGCDDAGVEVTNNANPNVKRFDSIWVEEDSSTGSFSGIDLLAGDHTLGTSDSRDASLYGGQDSTGSNFYLRTGLLDNILAAGHVSRWFQVSANVSEAEFDTMKAVYTNIGTALDTNDFTQESTEFWGYFNYPLASAPVYCFWLKGKRDDGLTSGKNVFGIIRPKNSFDNNPGAVYGFSMTFEVKINTNGENDFSDSIAVGN